MSKTRQILEDVTSEQPAPRPQISPEDRATLDKIKRDRARIAGWHPGDDSPFAGFADGYDGYTVSDARNHMTRIKQDIEAKYGITHEPSPEAAARQAVKYKQKQDTRASIEKQVAEQFPFLKFATAALWHQQDVQNNRTPYYGWSSQPKPAALQKMKVNLQRAKQNVNRALLKGGFKNVSAAAAYRAQANKLKDQLLVKAGLRKRW